MIANIIICLVIVCLFVLAVRHALKKHRCSDCCNCGGGPGCSCGQKKDAEANKTR